MKKALILGRGIVNMLLRGVVEAARVVKNRFKFTPFVFFSVCDHFSHSALHSCTS